MRAHRAHTHPWLLCTRIQRDAQLRDTAPLDHTQTPRNARTPPCAGTPPGGEATRARCNGQHNDGNQRAAAGLCAAHAHSGAWETARSTAHTRNACRALGLSGSSLSPRVLLYLALLIPPSLCPGFSLRVSRLLCVLLCLCTQGVRPLLLQATAVIAWIHLSWGQFELGRSKRTADCTLVASWVAGVGIMNAICNLALLLSPWMHPPPPHAPGRCLRSLRFSIYGLAFLCIPASFVLGVLGALWVHVDNCWEHIYMRNLTVVDAVVIQIVALVAIHYLYGNYVQGWEWWQRRCEAWNRAPWCCCCVRVVRGYRRVMFVILLLVCIGCARTLSAYHARRSRTFHWAMSPRPAPCAISCSQVYRPLAREQLCFNGHGVQVSIQNCMDDLNPNDRFPQGHANLQPCIKLDCSQGNNQRTGSYARATAQAERRANWNPHSLNALLLLLFLFAVSVAPCVALVC